MKKYLLSIAALLLGLLAHSQEADDLGNYAELSVVARLDLNPVFGSEPEFTLGNSSIYTYFTGSASEHFSWTLQNHWFSGYSFLGEDADPFEQFKGLGYSNTTNFIDMAYVDLSFGGWTFTLGKQCITTDGHEYDADDWDVYTGLATPLWNDLACYQWGGTVAYTTPSEMSTFSLQMTTSPFGERPFGSGLWSWSAQWIGQYDWFLPTWRFSVLGREGNPYGSTPRDYDFLVSLGNAFDFDDWSICLDWSNTAGVGYEHNLVVLDRLTTFEYAPSSYGLLKGSTFHGRVDYAPSERWNLALQGNYIYRPEDVKEWIPSWWNAGAIAEFFPLRDSDALRLHAYVAYDSLLEAFSFNVGARYDLTFNLW